MNEPVGGEGFSHGATDIQACVVCGERLSPTARAWIQHCSRCGAFRSLLAPRIGDLSAANVLDESDREAALESLRRATYATTLTLILRHAAQAPLRLLDVGCAHGWFLDAAASRGVTGCGVEPDSTMADLAEGRGHQIWRGYFPDAVPAGERFDIICFNDVLEHVPDIRAAIDACAALLNDRGILAICMPSSHGIFFRGARALDRVGISGPLERVWQRHFPSPHVHYLHPDLTERLVSRSGFTELARTPLPSARLRGLWSRLRYDRSKSSMDRLSLYAVSAVTIPFLRFLPKDIELQVFRRDAAGSRA